MRPIRITGIRSPLTGRPPTSPRAIKDDLLNTINGAMTVFQASKNNAEQRLSRLLETGLDPIVQDQYQNPSQSQK